MALPPPPPVLFGEVFRVSLAALRANRLRSLLTMLGIVIGVGAVIAMIALGKGAERSVKDRIARLGTTVLQVNPQHVHQAGVATTTTTKLTMQDVEMILDRSPNVAAVNPQQDRNLQVVWRNRNTNVQVTGTKPNFLEVRAFQIETGRMFTAQDDNARRRVAVLGGSVAELFDVPDAEALLGEQIRIAGRAFIVIGALKAKGATGFGDGDAQILIPFQTGRFGTFGTDRINDIWVLGRSQDSLDAATDEVQAALRRSHKLRVDAPDDFSIRNQAELLNTVSETAATFGLLLAGIAAVSLLVGGIGIMNIMLVSVTERTREIGIRKALGATRANIMLQFLTESVVLCLLGGAFGIGAGLVAAGQLQRSFGWNTTVDMMSVLVAFGFASTIGLVFGVWPARRAASLDPIEALRFE